MSIFTKRAPRNPDLVICDECLSCEYNRTSFTDCPNCHPPFLPGEVGADSLLDVSAHFTGFCESCGRPGYVALHRFTDVDLILCFGCTGDHTEPSV